MQTQKRMNFKQMAGACDKNKTLGNIKWDSGLLVSALNCWLDIYYVLNKKVSIKIFVKHFLKLCLLFTCINLQTIHTFKLVFGVYASKF